MSVFVVIWEDRHCDTSVHVFSRKDRAFEWAKEQAAEFSRGYDVEEITINESMQRDGWVYCCEYSCEGDGLRVVEVEVDQDD